jgi:hypothetical protein
MAKATYLALVAMNTGSALPRSAGQYCWRGSLDFHTAAVKYCTGMGCASPACFVVDGSRFCRVPRTAWVTLALCRNRVMLSSCHRWHARQMCTIPGPLKLRTMPQLPLIWCCNQALVPRVASAARLAVIPAMLATALLVPPCNDQSCTLQQHYSISDALLLPCAGTSQPASGGACNH